MLPVFRHNGGDTFQASPERQDLRGLASVEALVLVTIYALMLVTIYALVLVTVGALVFMSLTRCVGTVVSSILPVFHLQGILSKHPLKHTTSAVKVR